MIYIALYILLAFFALLDLLKNGHQVKPLVFWASVFLLIFISSIRWNVGTDWYSYHEFFSNIQVYVAHPEVNLMERGFTYINYAIASMHLGYTALLSLMAVLMIGIKAKVIFEHRQIMMISLFLYYCYYLGDIFGVRQFLAISLTLYSIRFIIDKRFLPFFVTVLIASSIHITAIFFIFSYWIYHIEYSPKFLYSLLLLALILGFMDIGGFAVDTALSIVGIDSRVGEKLKIYGEDGMETVQGNPYIAFAIGVAKRALFLPLFIGCQRFIAPAYQNRYTGYLNLLIFGNIIYLLFMISLPVIARLSTGFLLFEIFILGYLVIAVQNKWLRMLAFLLVALFGAFRLYNLIAVYWNLYIPFETIFAPSNIIRE
ncbi:EpsG family protein [Olivibacter jilunii]|uniref:EpsG family protein n=1 Tax=Olivibacter jilunii TaxID=985016 RepID=UPI003F14C969